MSQLANDLLTLVWYVVCGTGLLIVALAVFSKTPKRRGTSTTPQGQRPSSASTGEKAP